MPPDHDGLPPASGSMAKYQSLSCVFLTSSFSSLPVDKKQTHLPYLWLSEGFAVASSSTSLHLPYYRTNIWSWNWEFYIINARQRMQNSQLLQQILQRQPLFLWNVNRIFFQPQFRTFPFKSQCRNTLKSVQYYTCVLGLASSCHK